jgi:putative peptidoglycan lipid II flippase
LAMGVLNSWKHFFAPALAPVLLNLSIILCVLVFNPFLSEPILALALGVLLGGIAQLIFQWPFLKRKGIVFGFRFEPSHPGVKRVAALMAPSVLGLAVTQLNVLVSTFLASYLPEGSVSYLYYADRLLEFPMGIFAIAVATAVLPVMSEQAARKDWENLRETLSFALRLVFFVTLPAMIGLIVLRQPILNLLFQRGAFTAHSAEMTAQALLYYSVGLAGFAGVRIIIPAFYSLQDTKTPVKIAFATLVANAVLGALLMHPLQHGGLALATSLAAGMNFALLVFLLRKKMGRIGLGKIVRSFLKSFGASLLMGSVALIISLQGEWQQAGVTPEKIGLLGGAIIAAIAVYGATSYFLGSEELQLVLEGVRKRIKLQKR